jgi:hypothetical protein
MKKGHVLGIILIFIGVAWIIRQAGIFSVNWAASIKTMWPVFLVAAGATVMLGQRKKLVSAIWIITFVIFIGFGIYKRNEPVRLIEFDRNIQIDVGPLTGKQRTAAEKEIPLERDTEEGRLVLNLGTARLDLKGKDGDKLAWLDSNIPGLKQRISGGKLAVLEYSHDESSRKMKREFQLELNSDLKWDIDANLGLVDGTMNLQEIPVEQMNLKLGVGEMDIRLGQKQEVAKVNLWSGAANLDIYIPKGTGLKIRSGNIIDNVDIHNLSMNERDDFLVSENYETADRKIEIEIVSALSEIEVFVQ